MAGLIKRRKKKPPMSDDIAVSFAFGYFLLVNDLICLQIQRIPYGMLSNELMMVVRKLLAISIRVSRRGKIIACTSGLDVAISGVTLLIISGGKGPSSSIAAMTSSYTLKTDHPFSKDIR